MQNRVKNRIKFFLVGFAIGFFMTALAGFFCYKAIKMVEDPVKRELIKNKIKTMRNMLKVQPRFIVEDFKTPIEAASGKSFGKNNQFTFG